MTLRLALLSAALLAGPACLAPAAAQSAIDANALHPSAIDQDNFDPTSIKGFAPLPPSASTSPATLPAPSAHAASGFEPTPEMTARNQSLITNYLGTEPLLDNRIDITTQLAFSQGENNVATNVIVGRTGGANGGVGGPTLGNNIAAATQYSAQIGNANTGFNTASTNLYASGLSPLGNLVRNDVFVGTQVAAQVGNDNRAGNAILRGSAVND